MAAVFMSQRVGVAVADSRQVAFEVHGLILALHYEARFLRSPESLARANAGFDNILARCATPEALAASGPAAAASRRLKPVR